jgi:hypothetical protein
VEFKGLVQASWGITRGRKTGRDCTFMVFRLSLCRRQREPGQEEPPPTRVRLQEQILEQIYPFPTGKEICYEDLGCFSDAEPWAGTVIRPLKLLPWSPEKIDTHFLLYTNENPNNFQVRLLLSECCCHWGVPGHLYTMSSLSLYLLPHHAPFSLQLRQSMSSVNVGSNE